MTTMPWPGVAVEALMCRTTGEPSSTTVNESADEAPSTVIAPDVAPSGTRHRILVALLLMTSAAVPLKSTTGSSENPAPRIRTTSPSAPQSGLKLSTLWAKAGVAKLRKRRKAMKVFMVPPIRKWSR